MEPTETEVRPANITAGMDGGMTGPCMAAVAVSAAAKSSLYPSDFIIEISIGPSAAIQASPEPEIQPNIMLARIVT